MSQTPFVMPWLCHGYAMVMVGSSSLVTNGYKRSHYRKTLPNSLSAGLTGADCTAVAEDLSLPTAHLTNFFAGPQLDEKLLDPRYLPKVA